MIGKLTNKEVADLLYRIGQLYLLADDRWRSRTFLNAARVVEDLSEHVMETDLSSVSGIGPAVKSAIQDLCATGSCRRLRKLETMFPDAALDLTWIPGIGPVKAQELTEHWGVTTMEDLAEALEASETPDPLLHERVLRGLKRKQQGRISRKIIEPFARVLISELSACPHVRRVEIAGSWRRGRVTLKDLDVLLATDDGWHDQALAEIVEVAGRLGMIESSGQSKVRFRHIDVEFTIDVDLLLVNSDSWGSALCYFTGSKNHNERLRSIAKALGMKVNEYGIFRDNLRIGGAKEEDLYQILGIPYVEPINRRA